LEKNKVLVIGGGTAGMTSALEMAERGIEVVLVEKDSDIGGRAATYCCKATDECNRCAACLVLQQRDQVIQEPKIQVYTNASVTEIGKNGKGFKAKVVSGKKTHSIEAQAVIIATGIFTSICY
jgi:heterodisulfide reductase subunit A